MTFRHGVVMATVFVAGLLAFLITKATGGNAARWLQIFLFAFAIVLVANVVWKNRDR